MTRERRESPRANVRRRARRTSLTGVLETVVGSLGASDEKSVVRLLAAIRELDVAAFVADDHGQLIATNAAASRLTGYTERELRRLSVYDITGEGDVETMDVLWKAFASSSGINGDAIRSAGKADDSFWRSTRRRASPTVSTCRC